MSVERTVRGSHEITEAHCPRCGAECAVDWDAGTASCDHCGHVEKVSAHEVTEILEQRRRIAAEKAEQETLEAQAEAVRARIDDSRTTRETAGCLLQFTIAASAPFAAIGAAVLVLSTLSGEPAWIAAVMGAAPTAAAGANLAALRKGWEAKKILQMNGIGFIVTSMLLLASAAGGV